MHFFLGVCCICSCRSCFLLRVCYHPSYYFNNSSILTYTIIRNTLNYIQIEIKSCGHSSMLIKHACFQLSSSYSSFKNIIKNKILTHVNRYLIIIVLNNEVNRIIFTPKKNTRDKRLVERNLAICNAKIHVV